MTNLTASSTLLTVDENSLATTIGVLAPADANPPSSALTVTALPANGIILLADGLGRRYHLGYDDTDVGPSNTLVLIWGSLSVPKNSLATPIGISTPVDANSDSSQLTVKVTALPANGTVVLSDGTTPVTMGETPTVTQLTGLDIVPSANASNVVSVLTNSVSNPAGLSANGNA